MYKGGIKGNKPPGRMGRQVQAPQQQQQQQPQPPSASGNKTPNSSMPPHSNAMFKSDRIVEMVNSTLSGPQMDLPALDKTEKKFNAQSRVFVLNLLKEITTEELKAAFEKYGDIGQVYVNKEGAYGFINFDYRANAEKAIRSMHGKMFNGRPLTVRFAAVTTGIKVKNLSNCVSNELLEKAFRVFGNIEVCKVLVDSRGNSTGEAIVIFSDKNGAATALKKCEEECYFLTSTPRPVVVEPLEVKDEGDGLSELMMNKTENYRKEREIGPHFADPTSFLYEYGMLWKKLYFLYNEKKQSLEQDFSAEVAGLESKIPMVRHQYDTLRLRRELAAREAESGYFYPDGGHPDYELEMGTGNAGGSTGGQSSYRGGYNRGYDRQYDWPHDQHYEQGQYNERSFNR